MRVPSCLKGEKDDMRLIKTALNALFASCLLILFCAATACAQQGGTLRDRLRARREARNAQSTDAPGEIKVGDLTRTYLVHVPRTYNQSKPAPLVITLHGGGGAGGGMNRLTGMNALADREGFIVAYPDGIEHHWNDGRSTIKVKADDVAFIAALIERLAKDYNIDRRRVYATGISNGGFMTQRLACELSDKIAAIATVAATMPEELQPKCRPSRPVSVLVMDGAADPIVPYNGGEVSIGERGKILSVDGAINFWREQDRCSAKPSVAQLPDVDPNDGTRVTRESYEGCKGGSEVILYRIEGGGHTWAGGLQYLPERIIGKTSRDINASETIWNFLRNHALQ